METKMECWFYDRLFVKLSSTAIIPKKAIQTTRYGWAPAPKIKLPPVSIGCSLYIPDLKGMRSIYGSLLLAEVNMHHVGL